MPITSQPYRRARRSFVAPALAAAVLAAAARPAAADDEELHVDKIQLKATKVGGQVYVIEDVTREFSGGNVGVAIGPDGVVVIDDKFAPIAPKLEAALRGITDQPVRFVLNTHYHGDHTGGNGTFAPKATIVAHDNTRKRILSEHPKDRPPVPATALPALTFSDRLTLHLNGEEVRAIHLPAGHTDTDVIIVFPKSNVVHMGDDFFNGVFPFIDTDGGGSVKGLIAALTGVIDQLPADAKIIPGHGPVGTLKDLRAFLAMLKDTSAIVEAGAKAGKTAAQLKQAKVLAKYDALSTDVLLSSWNDGKPKSASGRALAPVAKRALAIVLRERLLAAR